MSVQWVAKELILPVDIPGQPDTITPQNVIDTFISILKNGVAILQRKPGIYPEEVQHATWWRFWVFVGGVTVLTAIMTTISGIIVQGQIAATFGSLGIEYTPPTIFNILITFILTVPIGIAVLYAGVYAITSVCIPESGRAGFTRQSRLRNYLACNDC